MLHGELSALQWQDANPEERRLSIKWAVGYDWEYGFIIGDPVFFLSSSPMYKNAT
jgi:hypothetical protein